MGGLSRVPSRITSLTRACGNETRAPYHPSPPSWPAVTLARARRCPVGAEAVDAAPRSPGADREDPEDRTRRQFNRIVQRQVPLRTFVLTIDLSRPSRWTPRSPTRRCRPGGELTDIVRSARRARGRERRYGRPGPATRCIRSRRTASSCTPPAPTGDVRGHQGRVTAMFGNPKLDVTVTDRRAATLHAGPVEPACAGAGEIVGLLTARRNAGPPPPLLVLGPAAAAGPAQVADPDGVNRDYVVDVATCSEAPLDRDGGVVVSAAPATDEAKKLLALTPGTPSGCTGRSAGRTCSTWSAASRCCSATASSSASATRRADGSEDRRRREGQRGDPPRRDRRPPAAVVEGRDALRVRPILQDLGAVDRPEPRRWRLVGDGRGGRGREQALRRARAQRSPNAILVLPGPDPGE